MKIILNEQKFNFLFENDDFSSQKEQILRLLKTGDIENIELAVQISKGLGINIGKIVDSLFGIFLKGVGITKDVTYSDEVVDHLKTLFNIRNLNLNNQQLTIIPDTIGLLTNVTSLELSNNNLKTLPSSIANMVNLTDLSVSDNKLENIPNEFESLIKLHEVYMSRNRLKKIPEFIFNLKYLEELSMSGNKIPLSEQKRLIQTLPNVNIYF